MLSPLLCSSDTVAPQSQKLPKFQMTGSELVAPKEKKRMTSPRSKKKQSELKTFGIPLVEALQRSPPTAVVPFCVQRICEYILRHGLSQEGIFRVNGNMKVVEQLKSQFNKNGDADLEDCGDIMAVAGLLKLYLRTLPDPVICESLHSYFVDAHKAHFKEKEKIMEMTSDLLSRLPAPNIHLLKYLCQFLVTVSQHAGQNKMTPMALAIVFGPNMFRCSLGFEGLREQSHVNAIVCLFIDEFDHLLGLRELAPIDSETVDKRQLPEVPVPYHEYQRTKSLKVKPVRPPPPNLNEYRRSNSDAVVIVSGMTEYSSDPIFSESGVSMLSPLASVEESSIDDGRNHEDSMESAAMNGKDPTRTTSPAMGVPIGRGRHAVDSVVRGAVKEHLFGPHGVLSSSSESDSQLDQFGLKVKNSDASISGEAVEGSKAANERLRRRVTSSKGDSLPTSSANVSSQHRNAAGLVNAAFKDLDPDFEVEPFTLDQVAVNTFDVVGSRAAAPLSSITANRAPLPRNRRKPSFSRSLDEDTLDTATLARRRLKEAREARGDLTTRGAIDKSDPMADFLSVSESKKKSASASDLVSSSIGRGYGAPSRSAIRMDIDRVREYRDDMSPSSHLRPKSMEVLLAAPTSPLLVSSPASTKATNVPPLDLVALQLDDVEQAQPSPMGRFAHVILDGPVRSPRSAGPNSSEEAPGAAVGSIVSSDDPPSPTQVHREQVWLEKRQDTATFTEMAPKDLKKRIESLKKIISNFESTFEEQHGRKPKPSEKGHVQKYIAELGRAKKQLKELLLDLKDHSDRLTDSAPNLLEIGAGPPAGHDTAACHQSAQPTKEETLNCLIKKLQEKRLAAGRPEEIQAMSEYQLSNEKLSVQKALLQYESIHCRPSTKEDKNLMRPLYERYRRIKRMLARANTAKGKDSSASDAASERMGRTFTEQESESEDPPTEMSSAPPPYVHASPRKPSIVRSQPHAPTAEDDDLGDTFSVTSRVPETLSGNDAPTTSVMHSSASSLLLEETVLHGASLEELLQQQNLARKSKKRIGKKLKIYEEDFFRETGRKITKEDRGSMENDYRDYKVTKARLRLLEALILKKSTSQMV